MILSGGSALTVVSPSGGSVTPHTERTRQCFTFSKVVLDLFDTSFAELGQLTLQFSVVAVVEVSSAHLWPSCEPRPGRPWPWSGPCSP